MVTTKRYKFQALIKPLNGGRGTPLEFDAAPRRIVLRAETRQSHSCQLFTALVSGDGNIGNYGVIVLRLAGDEVCDYLDIGEHFRLWLGGDIAEGVITRRLYV